MRYGRALPSRIAGFALPAALLSTALAAASAQAGVVITTERTVSQNEEPGQASAMYIDPDRIKMNAGRGEMIYRGDLNKVWMIDDAGKAYREMTPETMKAMKAQMTGAIDRMQKELAAMPPEQRAQVEKMMAQRGLPMPAAGGAAAQAPKVTYEKAGGSKTIKAWTCTPYKMSINGKFEAEQCIAKLGDVGLSRDDFKPFVSFAAFMSSLTNSLGGGPAGAFDFDAMSKAIGFDGVPVQTTHYGEDGKIDFQTTVRSVEHKNIPADVFEVPAGFKKQDMPTGRPPVN